MSTEQYIKHLADLEQSRQRVLSEMMRRPFGDRVMSDSLESELDAIEVELLEKPPLVTTPAGEMVPAGKGLVEDPNEPPLDVPPLGITVIPQSEWPAYIEGQSGEQQLHVQRYVEDILNQGSVGSCAGEGISGAIMAAENQSGQTPTKLNGYFPYHWSSGGNDRGSTLTANIRVAMERGVASEAVWPRSRGFRRSPSTEALEDAKQHRLLQYERVQNWTEFGTALLMGWPIYAGYSGHAWYAVRLISPTRMIYANSWSTSWGDQGFGTLSERRLVWSYGAFVVRAASENRQ